MRFEINEQVPFIRENFEAGRPRFGNLYLPWEDKLLSLEIIMLTCVEHHKVPYDHDPEDKLDCDGYVFVDVSGKRYYNQYPKASYGQISTDNNHRAWPQETADEESRDWFPFVTAKEFLSKLAKGVDDVAKIDEKVSTQIKSQHLQQHYDTIVARIADELKLKTSLVPYQFKRTDGTVDTIEGINTIEFTPIQTEETSHGG
jgi:hypothetical protein